ncbi:MAG: peptidoglycan-binding protein, partial [Alphaproteobacteria bacterium]
MGPLLLVGFMVLGAGAVQAQPAAAELDQAAGQALQQLLDTSPVHVIDNQPLDLAMLRRFYGERDGQPAWAGSERATVQAKLAVLALEAADQDGLNPADYHAMALAGPVETGDTAAAAARDLILTDAFVRYAHDLRLGRVPPRRIFDDVDLPPQDFDAAAALGTALKSDGLAGLIAELPPPHAEYARLRDALKRYRALAEKGGWPEIPPGDELRLDSGDARLAVLRQRLAAEDSALATPPARAVKGDLAAALRRFQTRNGLAVDGRIGSQTFAALNVGIAERVNQIIANMERWRWMPRELEERYVVVNAADGELRVIDRSTPILVSKVVIGDDKHQSPILRAMALSITVNPPWSVPPSIAQKEILPKLKQDPGYLEHENIVIL